jgi:hypothetical protein
MYLRPRETWERVEEAGKPGYELVIKWSLRIVLQMALLNIQELLISFW